MLNLSHNQWDIIKQGCDCASSRRTQLIAIINRVYDSLIYNGSKEEFVNIYCSPRTRVVRIECNHCGKTLFEDTRRD